MVRKCGESGVIIITALFFVCFTVIGVRFFCIAGKQDNVSAAKLEQTFTLEVGKCQGTIYDRNMKPLVNAETVRKAAAVPRLLDMESTAESAVNKEAFYSEFFKGRPFVYECNEKAIESDGLTVFEVPVRYSKSQTARHVIGYLSDDSGADGIEYAYDSVLRGELRSNSVSYKIDGFGQILAGVRKEVFRTDDHKSGIVLTLDKDIQEICEKSGSSISTGAVVCADIKNGDILAMASFPDYNPSDLGKALNDERCPLINRALYSYSVGSVFKIVTAAAALEQDCGDILYECSGMTDVAGKNFNCHKLDGHGIQDISQAMTNSCNTYFINLARSLDIDEYRRTASYFGFGKENYLCAGITGTGGVLPSKKELQIPAELANFAFGQGKLTASPLQITQMTCAVANKGKMPVLRLINGMTANGSDTVKSKESQLSAAMSAETAEKLREMMVLAISGNENSKAKSNIVSIGAKTSTAQTGQYNSDGEELCHAWITGFFPADAPKYALTVFIENGGYGNDAAAPVFRSIAESIQKLNSKNKV